MIQKIKQWMSEHAKLTELILYVFIGGCTTVVNWVIYFPLVNLLDVNYQVANVIAWIGAVIFAYITNKTIVFRSKTTKAQTITKELTSFVGARIMSLLLEMGIMWLTVSVMSMNSNLMKIVTAVVTVLFNYIASKLIIFRKKVDS